LIKLISRENPKNHRQFFKLLRQFSARQKLINFPKKITLIQSYQKLVNKKIITKNLNIEKFLKLRPMRSLSGVVVITALTKPYPCPGKCVYCPLEPNMPKSYLSNEPAAMRAALCRFDPETQIRVRLASLTATGHDTSKIEIIILGGNFSSYPKKYQSWFIKKIYDGLNGKTSRNLIEAQKKNEKAVHRCVGLTIEMRPDFVTEKELIRFRDFGVTRVEIGVQTIFDKILKLNQRGHLIDQTIHATKLLKDFGFKITYHLMPNLPGSNPKLDLEAFEKISIFPEGVLNLWFSGSSICCLKATYGFSMSIR
jgi:elongator complex protein 3